MQVAAYDKTQGKMAFFDPSRPGDFLFISGTKVCSPTYFSFSDCLKDIGNKTNKRKKFWTM